MTKENFPALLEKYLPQIQRALPNHLTAERVARVALTAFRRNPALMKCDPISVCAAVMQAAQLGLELDTLGRGYLVPYKKECQFIPGWRGLVDLVNRTGKATVWTNAVFVGDQFDYVLGSKPHITHRPMGESAPDKLLHVYACGKIKGMDQEVIESWPIDRVWRHRDKYNKVGKAHYSFSNQEMYARKVVLLQVLKYMPASTELETAINLSNAAEVNEQHLNIDDAINGTFETVSNDYNQAPAKNPNDIQTPKTKETPTTNTQTTKATTTKSGAANPGYTFEQIMQMISDAKTTDDVDVAVDAIYGLSKEESNKLTVMASNKLKALEPK